MPRPPKKGKFMNFKLDADIATKLEEYSEQSMIPKTRIVEKALKDFFENIGIEMQHNPKTHKDACL